MRLKPHASGGMLSEFRARPAKANTDATLTGRRPHESDRYCCFREWNETRSVARFRDNDGAKDNVDLSGAGSTWRRIERGTFNIARPSLERTSTCTSSRHQTDGNEPCTSRAALHEPSCLDVLSSVYLVAAIHGCQVKSSEFF